MSLRHALLGLLAERPMSGWDLTRMFDVSLANVWSARHSQIYPELARLQEDGLIDLVEQGARGRRVYSATDAGRQAVLDWLRGPQPAHTLRDEGLLRGFFAWMLPAQEAATLFRRDAVSSRAKLAEYNELAAGHDWDASPATRVQRVMLESGIRTMTVLAEWAEWAAEQCLAMEDGDDGA